VKRTDHPALAARFTQDVERTHWHDQALWFVRAKRDKAAQTLPEWEELRAAGQAIKAHTLARLADYLEQFETNAQRLGAHVHWAETPEQLNAIVHQLLRQRDVKRVVKSKSMLTEECHLNSYLEERGVEVVDTDLGERIVQLRKEPPSHIVLPAIHIKKEEVGELFHEHLGTEQGASDPNYLTEAARAHLREKFLAADAGVTGVNFAIASTGGFVVCTNEGNADLGVSLPKLHIACMGLEKIIPRPEHLGVFTRLLARSATGQPVTTYTSHFHGPTEGGELHIVLLDNGRSELMGDAGLRPALNCIRCGACMNTCPVYRRSGGHSYQATVPGPIGSVLNPASDPVRHGSLPFACSLCGSCTDVCPVKVPLHHQLLDIRSTVARAGGLPLSKRLTMKIAATVLRRRWLYEWAGCAVRLALRIVPPRMWNNRWNGWTRGRDMPPPPRQSFRSAYRNRKRP
jgi:L-lactate dehydrogenase complex protein LldF